jgi:hypothetical protein
MMTNCQLIVRTVWTATTTITTMAARLSMLPPISSPFQTSKARPAASLDLFARIGGLAMGIEESGDRLLLPCQRA